MIMPFGLKNVGAIYQRLMDQVSKHQIGQDVEVYMDDMVIIKSHSVAQHVANLEEVFWEILKYDMGLNLKNAPLGSMAENSWGS